MTLEQQIDHALAYFTDHEHPHSFELLPGVGKVLISAPHAVLQTRDGSSKCAERFTGMLCLLLHERLDCPVIYKSRHLCDDANHDRRSDYRDALCSHVRQQSIQYVLDLHQLSPERPMELCLCTGKGRNLLGQEGLVASIQHCFGAHGICKSTIDDPFDASSPYTVSSTVAKHCGIPAIQLELNTRLLMGGYSEYCFSRVLCSLSDCIDALNQRTPSRILH